ncbi:MAG: CvpA family protein, partial [Fusobacterium varium]|nr:CvpA family protein [Fusobacterium varium]
NYSTDMYTSLKKYSKGSYTNEIFLEVVPNIEKYVPEVFQDKIKELKNLELVNRYVNKLF